MDFHRTDGNEHRGEETVVGVVRNVKARARETTQLLKAGLETHTLKREGLGLARWLSE